MIPRVEFSKEKSLLLEETRGVGFKDIIKAIEKGKILDDIEHFNKKKYPNQRILIIEIEKIAYAVPYAIDYERKAIFLKTVYPNRMLTMKYLKKGKKHEKAKK